MRRLNFGTPRGDFEMWAHDALRTIETESESGMETILDEYSIANFTELRILNAGTATAGDVANFLCTLINDIQKRGSSRVGT